MDEKCLGYGCMSLDLLAALWESLKWESAGAPRHHGSLRNLWEKDSREKGRKQERKKDRKRCCQGWLQKNETERQESVRRILEVVQLII